MDTIEELVKHLKNRGCELSQCSEADIIGVEEYYNVKLPSVYKGFLLAMGNGAGEFMEGSSVFLDELFDLREGAIEIIRENDLGLLPENAFVFWLHQGYQMAYFIIDGPGDLPIYYFGEGAGLDGVRSVFNRIIDFLDLQLRMSGLSAR